jgi:hypothetical protein
VAEDEAAWTGAPPADLARVELPINELPRTSALYRIHRLEHHPLWFGRDRTNRFDDPQQRFGVCYFGVSREAAFAETFLRRPPVRLLSREFLDQRRMAEIQTTKPLRLIECFGPSLARLGTTASITSGPHTGSGQWSRAIWGHPSKPDGLLYRCRHDDSELAAAVYDRAAGALVIASDSSVRTDVVWFGSVLEKYGLALDD